MRVAHIITRLILGGAQENTVLNCEGLIHRYGDDVLLITGPALGPEGTLIDQAREHGIPLEIVPSLRRAIHPWRDWRSYKAIKNHLREFRPDVVHTHSAKGGLLGRAAARSLKVPAVVHTVHGAPFHEYQSRVAREFFRRCERWAAEKCDAMISVSDAMTESLVNAHVADRSKFTTIYSGLDVEPFLQADQHRERTRAKYGFQPEHVVVGKIARLFHLKGHEYLIRAATQVVRNHPNVRFLLVGDGILRSELEKQIVAAGLADYFVFAGLIPPYEVPHAISAMDVVVHCSLREGLARVLPQALIAGKPAVSYDIDGAREVVLPGKTGFLIPPCTVDELSVTLQRLTGDKDLREQLGAEGRRRFTDQFRHEHMTDRIRSLYVELLSRELQLDPPA